jgi:copper(I)-binding protein
MNSLLISIVLMVTLSTTSLAHEVKVGQLVIVHPMVGEAEKGQALAEGSVEIRNDSEADDRLLSVTCECADTVTIENGRPMTIPGKGRASVVLRFGNVKRKLSENEAYSGEMVFEKAGTVKMDLMVHSGHH